MEIGATKLDLGVQSYGYLIVYHEELVYARWNAAVELMRGNSQSKPSRKKSFLPLENVSLCERSRVCVRSRGWTQVDQVTSGHTSSNCNCSWRCIE